GDLRCRGFVKCDECGRLEQPSRAGLRHGTAIAEDGIPDMSNESRPASLLPFPQDYRASGVLLHVTSLPSRYGVGDVGPDALEWVDRLRDPGQAWWQALPLGPTGYGDSPYQPQSSFAGNELLISPDWLIEDGLLRASDVGGRGFPSTTVDYDAVIPF